MDFKDVDACVQDWEDLDKEYQAFEVLNKDYQERLEKLSELQEECLKNYNHHSYRLKSIKKGLAKLQKDKQNARNEKLEAISKQLEKRTNTLHEILQSLPKLNNGLYLKIILGNVNVSILNKNDKFRYKDEYEKFKLVLSAIGLGLSVLNLTFSWRPLELVLMFLLVWYYCTLTIRESILQVNGSRIKGWWRLHHFISTFTAGVLLIWPQTEPWYIFRNQFMWFNCYISFVQYLQFRYQQGVLYRLRTLGERHNMDITIEGFHSWMWRGLGFLLPFLFIGYLFQLYNAYVLFVLSSHPSAPWQVPVLSLTFFSLFLGNIITTCIVIHQKYGSKVDQPTHNSTTKKQE